MKKKEIQIPIFFGSLLIIKAKNWDSVNKKYGVEMHKGYEACVFKHDHKDGRTRYVAAFVKKPQNKIIAHEATHLVNHVFIDRNMKLDEYNDEPQAYLMGWFFEQIENFFKEKK